MLKQIDRSKCSIFVAVFLRIQHFKLNCWNDGTFPWRTSIKTHLGSWILLWHHPSSSFKIPKEDSIHAWNFKMSFFFSSVFIFFPSSIYPVIIAPWKFTHHSPVSWGRYVKMRNEHLLLVNLNERPREDTPVLENCTSCCDVHVNTCSHIVKLLF